MLDIEKYEFLVLGIKSLILLGIINKGPKKVKHFLEIFMETVINFLWKRYFIFNKSRDGKTRRKEKRAAPFETAQLFFEFYFLSKLDITFYKLQIKMIIVANIFPLVIFINPPSFKIYKNVLYLDFFKLSSRQSSSLQLRRTSLTVILYW